MSTRARLLYVAALLLLFSWKRPAIMSAAQQDDGRCEKITIPLCIGMKYNMTRMPNLVGIPNQKDAALQVRQSPFEVLSTVCPLFAVASC